MATRKMISSSRAATRAKKSRSTSSTRKPLHSKIVTIKSARDNRAPAPLSCNELADRISQLRETVIAKCMHPAINCTADEVNAIRRVIADILEGRMIGILQKLASLRQSVPLDAVELANRVDALLEDLGAIRFTAEKIEHMDPVIHAVGKEIHDPEVPDGVIVSTIRPGWRTAQGQILARAVVSLNRRM